MTRSLRELEATFIAPTNDGWIEVETFAEAKGVSFLCPRCFETNKGRVGTHIVICWFAGVPIAAHLVGPGRWNPQGTSLDDLSFVGPGKFSVLLTGGCRWHGFITTGKASILPG